jgi:hypothetical protein
VWQNHLRIQTKSVMTQTLRLTVDGPDGRAMLLAYLAQCRAGVTECFTRGAAEGARLGERNVICQVWCDYHLTAARLIETSLAITDRLQGGRKYTHRIIVERVTPGGQKTTRCVTIERMLPPSRIAQSRRAAGLRTQAESRPPIAAAAARERRGRGARRGNSRALKDPRLRACREICGRYRNVIRAARGAMALYDALEGREAALRVEREAAAARRRAALLAVKTRNLARPRAPAAPLFRRSAPARMQKAPRSCVPPRPYATRAPPRARPPNIVSCRPAMARQTPALAPQARFFG